MIKSADEFIKLCASHDSEDVNRTLSEEAPIEIWKDIINNFPANHIDVAQNRTIPEEVMRLIVAQGNETSRSIIAEKGQLATDLFEILSKDKDEWVRTTIASHRKTSVDLLKILSLDSCEDVAKVAQLNLNKKLGKLNKKTS